MQRQHIAANAVKGHSPDVIHVSVLNECKEAPM